MKYFDLHCDTLTKCFDNNKSIYDPTLQVNLGGNFVKRCQNFAIFVDERRDNAYNYFRSVLEFANSEFSKLENLKVVKTAEDFKADEENQLALLSLEGGAPVEENLDRIAEFSRLGILWMSLCWNGSTALASGILNTGGITNLGRAAIDEMNKNAMALDVSHLNNQGLFEAIERAETVLASHSNCSSVFYHLRNLPDEALIKICEKKGLIGLCFYPSFLGGRVFEKLYENIVYMLNLGLEESIALGSDFDGAEMDEELKNEAAVYRLADYLIKMRIPEDTVNKIFWNNAEKFLNALLLKRRGKTEVKNELQKHKS